MNKLINVLIVENILNLQVCFTVKALCDDRLDFTFKTYGCSHFVSLERIG